MATRAGEVGCAVATLLARPDDGLVVVAVTADGPDLDVVVESRGAGPAARAFDPVGFELLRAIGVDLDPQRSKFTATVR